MTGRELIAAAGAHPLALAGACLAAPVVALIAGTIHARGERPASPWKYVYAVLVYAVCVPGMASAVLTAYTLFFTNENLLDVNLMVYLAPVVSMTATLLIIGRRVDFDAIPGFDRLSGLMTMIGVTFALVLGISKTRIWIVFGGSIGTLLILCGALFALLKWGSYMAFRRSDERPRPRPDFPS